MAKAKSKKRTGTFAGVPYDWRRPTWQRIKSRWWNPNAPLITPRSYGWGYDFNLFKIRYGLLVAVWVITMLIAAYVGDMYALRNTSFQAVTPDQLTNAMQQDDFYSTYRENTITFYGIVSSVSNQDSETMIGIKTTTQYDLTCAVENGSQRTIKVGDNAHFAAEAYRAAREPMGVLLNGCIIL